jgi:hypothetical protein
MHFSVEKKGQRNEVANWKLDLFEYLKSSPFSPRSGCGDCGDHRCLPPNNPGTAYVRNKSTLKCPVALTEPLADFVDVAQSTFALGVRPFDWPSSPGQRKNPSPLVASVYRAKRVVKNTIFLRRV